MKLMIFGMILGAAAAVAGGYLYHVNAEHQSAQVVASTADSAPVDARFFAHLQELRQNQDKLGDFLLARDRLSAFVQEEMVREPREFAALIEEAIPLVSHIGPIAALKLEPYATEAVHKAIQGLREEARVADFLQLKEQIQAMEKQVAAVQQQALLFSSVVPVLLVNSWGDCRAVFQITNLKTKEHKVFTLSQARGIPVTRVIYLLPGEYEVGTDEPRGSDPYENFVLVHPEPKDEYEQKQYHAVIITPSVPKIR